MPDRRARITPMRTNGAENRRRVTTGTLRERTNDVAAALISYNMRAAYAPTMSTAREDRWLLPRRQTEYPTWELVAEERLHGRREATFLVLAAVFLVTAAALILLGASRIIDPSSLLATALPEVELPIAIRIPLGAIPFALGGLSIALVVELYGR